MKFFIAIALFAAAASARILPADLHLTPAQAVEVEQIMAAIHSPSTDPTTGAMLEQMLMELLGLSPAKPPVQLPAVVDNFEPIHVGPAIVDSFEPIHVGPAIVDFPIPEGALEATPVAPAPVAPAPEAPAAATSPLVQIVVNVNQQGGPAPASPVVVDNMDVPTPVAVVEQPAKPEIVPTPVMVVEQPAQPEINPTPVMVVEEAFVPQPEPVVVAPILVVPAVVGPDTLN